MTTQQIPEVLGANDANIVPSLSLEALLARRDAAVAQLVAIAEAAKRYGEIGDAIGVGEHSVRGHYKFCSVFDRHRGPALESDTWLKDSTARVDAALWDFLLDRSGLRTFMDSKARQAWDEQIEKLTTPALTDENVRATFARLHGMRGELFERGVLEVFRHLSWDYKTNQPQRFGKRIVVRHVLDGWGHPSSGRASPLDDLDRALHVLDGKPEPDHRASISSRLWQDKNPSSPYLSVRTFKNGNGHVTFLRPDLVDELNRILAKHHPHALGPAREAA